MTRATPKVIAMPADPKARRERQLFAKWAREDALLAELRKVREEIRPLQTQVSLDAGYCFTIGRENLERALKARKP
jgi:hypothetical protein